MPTRPSRSNPAPAPLPETEVRCPRCRRPLGVPAGAAGLRARCPACHATFVVPRPDDLLEETVSSWLEQDVNPVIERRNRIERELADGRGTRSRLQPRHMEWGEEDPAAQRAAPQTAAKTPPASEEPITPPAAEALAAETDRPWLALTQVRESGIDLAFDSRWLADPAFQLAMPMRCAWTGEEDPALLRARPMVFADQAKLSRRRAAELACRLEHHVVNNQSPEGLRDAIGPLKGLPAPFNAPVLWYVSGKAAGKTLPVRTSRQMREAGPETHCLVRVPDPRTALEWVGRVNGHCSRVYGELAQRIGEMGNRAWDRLADTTRLRLESWLHFQPSERFLCYLNEANFDSDDPGWAGVVLTDRRFIFHKYQRHVEVALGEPALLLVRVEQRRAHLSLERSAVCTTLLGQVRAEDVQALTRALPPGAGLRIEIIGNR